MADDTWTLSTFNVNGLRAAIEAVKRWRFIPASRAGIPVDHRVHIPIRFRLSRSAEE